MPYTFFNGDTTSSTVDKEPPVLSGIAIAFQIYLMNFVILGNPSMGRLAGMLRIRRLRKLVSRDLGILRNRRLILGVIIGFSMRIIGSDE